MVTLETAYDGLVHGGGAEALNKKEDYEYLLEASAQLRERIPTARWL